MKKFLLGLVLGGVIGGAAIWSLRPSAGTEPSPAPEAEPPAAGVRLTREQQAAAGLVIARPEAAEAAGEIKAFGRVLDPTPLASLLAEIATAESAAAATTREWERLRGLGENTAARSLEAAEAAMKRDRAAAESARGRLLGGWGKALAGRPDLAAVTRALLAQEMALARADLPAGVWLGKTPSSVRAGRIADDTPPQPAELIGPAPSADPQSQGQAFLLLLRERPPAPGTALAVRFPDGGAAARGFLLPRAAVIQHEGGLFVFVRTGDEQFERKPVEPGPPQPGGVFVKSGINAEDRIVATGAQQLLSEELKAANHGE